MYENMFVPKKFPSLKITELCHFKVFDCIIF